MDYLDEKIGLYANGDKLSFTLPIKTNSPPELLIFDPETHEKVIGLHKLTQSNNLWKIEIDQINPSCPYALRINDQMIFDPWSKSLTKNLKSFMTYDHIFNWEGDTQPNIETNQLIIYELHIKGFTKHPSSKSSHPGTFLGILDKIDHLKRLGINAIELMPIYQFIRGEHQTPNYWGYSPLSFFSLMPDYASRQDRLTPIKEFKTLVKELHKHNIKVILDVVYNHTSKENPLMLLDRSTYYINDNQEFIDHTGCGNTINPNHPTSEKLILDSLRYFKSEFHIDGFRFDLASTLTKDHHGSPTNSPRILNLIQNDPLLKDATFIAEPWDNKTYQQGSFPSLAFSEWNGQYRDIVRQFIRGTLDDKEPFVDAIIGSPSLFKPPKTPENSINFITCHDGFSLYDLVSYNQKHNENNNENNNDGTQENYSWNMGEEGHTLITKILALRKQQMINFLHVLTITIGPIMFRMGDELAHTQNGNNNAYCQDNTLSWLNWSNNYTPDFLLTLEKLMTFRKKTTLFFENQLLSQEDLTFIDSPLSLELIMFKSILIAFNTTSAPSSLQSDISTWKIISSSSSGNTPSILSPYSSLIATKRESS